jgi:predicted AlkP superfamily pyrophosphatase or phosphodiesterase
VRNIRLHLPSTLRAKICATALLPTLLLALLLPSGCASRGGSNEPDPSTGSARPATLILIGIDGFRWDYLELHSAPNIERLGREGVQADGLIPVFPSKTFPNHYSIVTGLYPDHHGIVANNIRDRELGTFALSDRNAVEDGRWWQGEPIWSTSERQGVRTATYFWPGSEAEIAGFRPSYWKKFDNSVPGDQRVDTVLEWLELPSEKRPRLLTLYFSDVDTAGHTFGPESEETRQAVARVDGFVGRLLDGLDALNLPQPVDLLIVSDHGMAEMSRQRVVFLEDAIAIEELDIIARSCILMAQPTAAARPDLAARLDALPHLHASTRESLSQHEHFADLNFGRHPRVPEIVADADVGWWIERSRSEFAERQRFSLGMHGFSPVNREMHGLFIAHGPSFEQRAQRPATSNLHLYELMAAVLQIEPAPNDGDAAVARTFLAPARQGSAAAKQTRKP